MPKQRPPGKLAERVREVVSAPARRGVAEAAQAGRRAARPAARRAGAGPGAASFEFGSLSVESGAAAAARATSAAGAALAPGAPKVAAKVPGAPTPPRDGAPMAARGAARATRSAAANAPAPLAAEEAAAPTAVESAAGSSAAAAGAGVAPPISAALGPSAGEPAPTRVSTPPDLSAGSPPAGPGVEGPSTSGQVGSAPELASQAGAGAGDWAPVFQGLGAVAAAILARLDEGRGARSPAPHDAPAADRAATAARERADAEWSARLEALRRMALEVSRGSRDARQAALGAELRPDAAAEAPLAAEAARLAETARLVAAAMGAVRSLRDALRGQPPAAAQAQAEQLAPRWAEVEALLGRLEAGSPVPGGEVDAAAAGAGGALAATVGGAALFAAGAEIRAAFREGMAAPGAAPEGARVRLDRAAALASASGDAGTNAVAPAPEGLPAPPPAVASPAGVPPAPPPAAAPPIAAAPAPSVAPKPAATARALRDEGHEPGPADAPGAARREHAEGKPRPERPATWELRVSGSSTEVGLADVARALGAARLEDVRDVLREGLATRHQFVVWTRAGTTLDDALRAAVNEGLVETRTQDPQERPPRGSG